MKKKKKKKKKRRRNEGMLAADESWMMLRMAENHDLQASKHTEMFEEKGSKRGIKEAREKVAMEMGEMLEKGYGNVTFGSDEIRPGEYIERKKENWQGVRWKGDRRRRIGMKKREEFRERVRAETCWKTKRAAKLLEVWVKRLGLQVMMLLC